MTARGDEGPRGSADVASRASGVEGISLAIVSCPFEPATQSPDELLARYPTLVRWSEALVNAGAARVTVLQRFWRPATLHRNGVEYRFVSDAAAPTPPAWFVGRRLAREVCAACPSVVHVDGLVFPLLVRQLRWRLPARVPVLVQDHGGIHIDSPGFRSPRWRMVHRLGLRAADGFLFTTRALSAPWLDARIFARAQPIYEVVESSADLGRRRAPTAPREPGSGEAPALPGRPALLWVGRLDANKDPLTVLDGFERAIEGLPHAILTMVFGADEWLATVREKVAASPRLTGRVRLLGRLEHGALPPLYASADYFVLGSHHEGSGFALIEALSFGVTPLVTDIPAFRALTDGGRLGGLFPPGDAQAMAAALLRLAHDPVAASRDGARDTPAERRRAQIRSYFDAELAWPALGRKALAIYESARCARASATGFEAPSPQGPRRARAR